jgi:hypothetical protein
LQVKSKKIANLSELNDFFKMQSGAIHKAFNRLKNEKSSIQAKNPTPILEGEATSNTITGSFNKKSKLNVIPEIKQEIPMIENSFNPPGGLRTIPLSTEGPLSFAPTTE